MSADLLYQTGTTHRYPMKALGMNGVMVETEQVADFIEEF